MDTIRTVEDLDFWRRRLNQAHAEGRPVHAAIYDCSADNWNRIQNESKVILDKVIKPGEHVLDVGCGFGSVYPLLPTGVEYTGIDLSPDFVHIAQLKYPRGRFMALNARHLDRYFHPNSFDWVIVRSVIAMLQENCGDSVVNQVKKQIIRVSRAILTIDYENPVGYSIERLIK